MAVKEIHFSRRARRDIEDGVKQLAAAVKVTLGPQGNVVAIEKKYGPPLITKDGVTVAKNIELEDRFENAATQMVREVAVKTSETSGDGTTTATILAEAIFLGSLHNVEAGANPIDLERGIRRAVDAVSKYLDKIAKPVKGSKDIERIATIAANNDETIGALLAEALEKVGVDGAVTVEEGRGRETHVEHIEGMQFDQGFLSPHFINRPQKLQCVLDEPYILCAEKRVDNVQELVPILEQIRPTGKPFLLIAEDVSAEALAVLVVNRMRGVFESSAVKAPGFGDKRKENIEDIAVMTGSRPLMADLGIELKDMKLADLGRAKSVIIEKDSTTIVKGGGKAKDVEAQITRIKARLAETDSKFEKEKLEGRLAKLSGGVAQINVGASTEVEMKEKHARIEDALHAARAASEEGVVPGGGVALARAAAMLDKLKATGDERVGIDIVRNALDHPLRQIAENARVDGSVVAYKVLENKNENFGYNALTNEYEDLVKAGVIDAKKVVRGCLQNAASVATILLTTEAIITEKPGQSKAMPPGFEGGMPPM